MDEIKSILENLQKELIQQKKDMYDIKEDIKNTINNNINEKFTHLENKNLQLENKLAEHSLELHKIDRFLRRKNLVFFGIEEGEKKYHDLEYKIINIISKYFGLRFENCIEAVRRIGKKGEKTRPVVVTFITLGLKMKILQNQKCLNDSPYYIKQDFSPEVQKKRKDLQPQLQQEREAGNIAFLKYDKLIVLPGKNNNYTQNSTNKRLLSESPETNAKTSCSVQNNKKQPIKKSKTKFFPGERNKTNSKSNIEQYVLKTIHQTNEVSSPPSISSDMSTDIIQTQEIN
ncbi:uncharacterized protein LOC121735654 [Aricia agestis]|uniref:uncharacterized protein LOC121735654 n=1 Tax=Aricia agestis TaxID=91739 RepID=UPI001C2038B9|nr:uncharacterized protein LOC121735654 [Aricia agestis]